MGMDFMKIPIPKRYQCQCNELLEDGSKILIWEHSFTTIPNDDGSYSTQSKFAAPF